MGLNLLNSLSSLSSPHSSFPDSASTSAFMTPFSTPFSLRSQSPLLSPPAMNEASSSATGQGAKENQFFLQDLTKSLKKVEMDRSDSSDRSNGTSSGVGASIDTNDDQLNSTLPVSSSSCKGSGRGTCATPTSLADKGKSKGRSKKRLNGLQDLPHDAPIITPFTSVDDQADGFIEKKRKGSPKGKKKKKGSANASLEATTHANLQVPQETQHGSKGNGGGSLKAPKSGPQRQQIGFENSSISSASPPSSVCSHSPLTLSPSPTSSFSGQLVAAAAATVDMSINPSLHKLLARPNLSGARPTSATAKEGSEGKDEWPDLGMDFGTPPPKPKVLKHLEVEAKSLESSPECRTEEEDSGCNMSVGSSSELSAAAGGVTGGAAGGVVVKQVKLPLETPPLPPLLAKVPVSSGSGFLAVGNAPHFGGGGRGGGLLGSPFGNALLPPPLPPPNQHHLSSQHYLWMQSQQLNVFIQQHQEQHEKQTTNHIFYPVEPIGQRGCVVHPAPPPPLLQHPPPPLLQLPLLQHLLPLHLPLPQPRPLFFPPMKPQVALNHPAVKPSDSFSPPTPPPPPPLPVRPYLPARANQLGRNEGKCEKLNEVNGILPLH